MGGMNQDKNRASMFQTTVRPCPTNLLHCEVNVLALFEDRLADGCRDHARLAKLVEARITRGMSLPQVVP